MAEKRFMKREFILKFLVTFALVVTAGCGYHFTGGGTLPAGSGVVRIDIFENRSSEAGLESRLANSLIYEFTRNGQNVNRGDGESDSTLKGVVTSVYEETVSGGSGSENLERRIFVTVDARLVSSGGDLLWQGRRIREKEVYTVDLSDPSGPATETRKERAIETLLERLAETLYGRMTVDF